MPGMAHPVETYGMTDAAGSPRHWLLILLMVALGSPGIIFRLFHLHPNPEFDAAIFGVSILAAAFLLSWAAETAEIDISQGLALAVLAFIAVLPEYAVDFVLAWKAGADPAEAERGLAPLLALGAALGGLPLAPGALLRGRGG